MSTVSEQNTAGLRRMLEHWRRQDVERKGPERAKLSQQQREQMRVGTALDPYVQKALDDECKALASAPEGERAKQAFKSAAALGQLVGGGVLPRETAEQALLAAAATCGLPADEARGHIRRGLDEGVTNPRGIPESATPVAATSSGATGAGKPKFKPDEKIILRACEVTPEKVEWLWPGRIPLGMLTTFAGVTSLGKTFTLCDIAARVSRGLDWPDSKGECCRPGQVLFISGEDSLKYTIVPRLIEAGADLEKVVFLANTVQDLFTLADLTTLDEALKQGGGGFRFVAIDPPTAFLPDKVDDHKNAELRRILSPLKSWAERWHLALVFNTHFNKSSGADVDVLSRVMGSVAWVNAVRAAHMFCKDQHDQDKRLFLPLKTNIESEPKGLAYRIVKKGVLAAIEWLGEVDTTAMEASQTKKEKGRAENAAAWLIERFCEKQEWPSDELFERAKEDGISRNAIFAAKTKLALPRAHKNVKQDGSTVWIWWVPSNWKPLGGGV